MKYLFDKILLLDSKKYNKYIENINSKLYFINNIIKLNNDYLIQIEEKIKSYPNIQYSYLRQQSYFIVIGIENKYNMAKIHANMNIDIDTPMRGRSNMSNTYSSRKLLANLLQTSFSLYLHNQ